ncbi:hypothetical protein DSM03_1175 [Leeuwenhoekiella aestuarii]|nr:hypothetical protein DSM03_1175 [Leeuwenhoekiella aestuarii]
MNCNSFLVITLLVYSTLFYGQSNTLPVNGKIGIGTLSPQGTALNVVGTGTIGPSENLNNSWALVGTPNLGIGIDNNQITQAGDQLYLEAKDGEIRFKTKTIDRGVIDVSGSFGFGTITPVGKVEIRNTGTLAGSWQPDKSFLNINDGVNTLLIDPNEIYGSTTLHFGSVGSGDIAVFRTLKSNSAVDVMTIKGNGKVGIGTKTTGSHKLAVEGSIGAREIKVEIASWPDYVFKDSYNLIPLNQLEKFVSENGHLPDVPKEQKAKSEGINLGEMNAILLKKIEELTLYLIEEHKTNRALSKRIETLEKIIK